MADGTGEQDDGIIRETDDNYAESGRSGLIIERPKRKGRKPYPRDENGNIIRDGNTDYRETPAGSGNEGGGTEREASSASGRKPGRKSQSKEMDIGSLTLSIAFLHHVAAIVTGYPGWVLTEKEAALLAAAVQQVLRVHDIKISAKAMAYSNLMSALVAVYAGRAMEFKAHMDSKKKPAQDQGVF